MQSTKSYGTVAGFAQRYVPFFTRSYKKLESALNVRDRGLHCPGVYRDFFFLYRKSQCSVNSCFVKKNCPDKIYKNIA